MRSLLGSAASGHWRAGPLVRSVPGTLEQLQGGFDSTLNLLLALLGGAAISRVTPGS